MAFIYTWAEYLNHKALWLMSKWVKICQTKQNETKHESVKFREGTDKLTTKEADRRISCCVFCLSLLVRLWLPSKRMCCWEQFPAFPCDKLCSWQVHSGAASLLLYVDLSFEYLPCFNVTEWCREHLSLVLASLNWLPNEEKIKI